MKSALVVLVGSPFIVMLACSSVAKDTGEGDTLVVSDTADSAADTATDSASPTGDDTGHVDSGDTSDTGAPPDTADTDTPDTSDTGTPPDTSDTGAVDTSDTGAPPDTADTGAADLCADLPGSAWNSIDELECGRGAGGMAMCHWRIQFGADGTFNWRYSDVAEVGEWSCTAGVLSANTWSRGSLTATLVDATHLTWVDVAYVRE